MASDTTHSIRGIKQYAGNQSTFGYPLAADETDDVDIEHVVELYSEQGQGAHAGFPSSPDAPDESVPLEFAFDPVGVQIEPDAVTQSIACTRCSNATAFVVPFLGHNFGVGGEAGRALETLAKTRGDLGRLN